MTLEQKIEAILFWKGEPMQKKKLADVLGVDIQSITNAIETLKSNISSRGIVLQEKEGEVSFGTASELAPLFEKMQKEELNKELSRASLETLSIILYKNGATRAEVDYIRGVNSSFTLRALSVRGLIEKISSEKDSRVTIYKPTLELLSFMGLKSISELPEYDNVKQSLSSTINLLNDNKLQN